MSACSYRPDRRGGVRTSAMRLPEDLLAKVREYQYSGGSQAGALRGLALAFHDLRNEILLWRVADHWKEFTRARVSPFDWPIVVSLVAAEGYQPYIEALPLPLDVRATVRVAALEVLKTLRARPDLEPAYQELASRTVVGGAADAVSQSVGNIDSSTLTREEQHRELADLFPFICSVWSLGREVRQGAVRWRPIVFQGMEVA